MPTLSIRLTDKQDSQLKTESENFGLTRGSFIKKRVFGSGFTPQRVPRPDQVELSKILHQLGKIGGNLNQVTKAMHNNKFNSSNEMIPFLNSFKSDLIEIRQHVRKSLGFNN